MRDVKIYIREASGTNWLYKNEDIETRLFAKMVRSDKEENVLIWEECTNEEKEEWEREHPAPEPPENE